MGLDEMKGINLIFERPRDDLPLALHGSIRVLVAYAHSPAVLAEVKGLIAVSTDMIVVGEVHDGPTALSLATELKPDVIILDIPILGLNKGEDCRGYADGLAGR
jgi:CheY-like chemotaxis protein